MPPIDPEDVRDQVTPFTIQVSDAELDDLRHRIRATRWPEPETVADWSQGVPSDYLRSVCTYWAESYDWRVVEARLNSLGQFRTTIDGLDIHFLHVRSPHPDAMPLILTHGWPGSVLEFLDVIGPLVDPAAHGRPDAGAFHVVIPSLPGFAWSGRPTETGWGIPRTAHAWAELMSRLGYERYGVQGGDWGSAVSTVLARIDPEHVAGFHLNMLRIGPGPDDSVDDPGSQAALEDIRYFNEIERGYASIQGTRPQTIGYGLTDSPTAQAAWILEKFHNWSDCDGDPVAAFGIDRLLDNISTYWLTRSAASSARIYWETYRDPRYDPEGDGWGRVSVPMGMSVFPKEMFKATRTWAERVYSDVRHWNVLERGGHFAAFERPAVFVDEVRTFFDLVR